MTTTYKGAGIARVLLGLERLDDVDTGAIDNIATTLPVGAGQGADYAIGNDGTNAVSATNPIRIKIDNEVMWVTARATDNLTVVRGKEGTVAAAHTAGVGKVHALQVVPFTFANAFDFDPQSRELTYEGDSQEEYVTRNLGLRGRMAQDKFETEIIEQIIGAVGGTTNLPYGEAIRYYLEGGAYPNVQIQADMITVDDQTGLDIFHRMTIFRGQIYPRPWFPPNLANVSKFTPELSWTALKVTTDIIGHGLVAVPSGGAFAALSRMTAA